MEKFLENQGKWYTHTKEQILRIKRGQERLTSLWKVYEQGQELLKCCII